MGFGVVRLFIGEGNFEFENLGSTYISQVSKITIKIEHISMIKFIINVKIGIVCGLYVVNVTIMVDYKLNWVFKLHVSSPNRNFDNYLN